MANWQNPCEVTECRNIVGRKGARGWCSKHYQMWLQTGDPQGSTAPTVEERFWAKVRRTGGCWWWLASTDDDGYGMFKDSRTHRAHRWLYEQINGPLGPGLVLDHTCRNPRCVRPDHLDPVTNDENLERGLGRRIKTGLTDQCINGHRYTPENTYTNPLGRKVCRACAAVARAKYERKAA